MNKKTTIIIIAAALILAVGSGMTAYFAARYYNTLSQQMDSASEQMKNVSNQIDSMQEEVRTRVSLVQSNVDSLRQTIEEKDKPQETKENDVTIASEYVIRATTQISDAYISGDSSALSDKDKETLDMAAAVLKQIINERMDSYDKELAVYDWMTANLQNDPGILPVVPTTKEDCDNPYGVLKYHNAVCVGYATTFRLFMQMLDIPCMVVHNNECYHSWDLVQLNGHWYHTDIYSDVGSGNHTHFNRTDSMQQIDQTWDTAFFPKSDSEADCYAVRTAVVQRDVFKIPAEIRKAIDERKTIYLSYRIPKEADNRSALVMETMMNRIQERVQYNSSECSNDLTWQWLPLENEYVLSISINQYNSSDPDPSTLPEEDLNRIDNIMEEVFGDYEVYCD